MISAAATELARVQPLSAAQRERVVIVGGGISGLAAGYLLRRACPQYELTVLERSERAGGLIQSEKTGDGFLWESGPDSMVTFKPQGVTLATELGLAGDLIEVVDPARRACVQRGGRLVPLPNGLTGTLPSSPWSIFGSPLFSWFGKLRMACEPLMPQRSAAEDESVAEFVTRRFGAEALDRLVGPLVGGIYACDPTQLSARVVLGPYVDYEARLGSVARGMHAARQKAQPASRAAKPAAVSFKDGMGMLTQRLREALGPALRLGTGAALLERGSQGGWCVITEHGEVLSCGAVVLACPPARAAQLVAALAPGLAEELAAISSSDVLHVALSWPREAVQRLLESSGFIAPPSELGPISACTFSSEKWPGRAPASHASFRCYMRDASGSDASAIEAAVRTLQPLLGIDGAPEHVRVTRLAAALPRYSVGHLERMARIGALLQRLPGVSLAGNAYVGAGIPDCIRSAELAIAPLVHAAAAHARAS